MHTSILRSSMLFRKLILCVDRVVYQACANQGEPAT